MSEPTFAELGKIEAIRSLFEGTPYEPFAVNTFDTKDFAQAISASKVFLEGIDFDLVYFPLKHLGYKSVVQVAGELYSGMAEPRALSVVLGVSAKLDFSHIRELWEGIVTAAQEFGFRTLSLELMPSPNGLCISVSGSGGISHKISSGRPKPRSKDLLCVSGRLGAAYLGMQLLEKQKSRFEQGDAEDRDALEKNRMLVAAYLKPDLDAGIPKNLRDAGIIPSAGVFVTQGLSDAVLRLGRSCGLGVKVYADMIPFEGNSFAVGKEMDIDPVSAAMNGGDDCQLLFTIPILQAEKFRKDFQTFAIIGHLALPEAGCSLVLPTGVEMPVTAQGWSL